MDLTLRRFKFASRDLLKQATIVPKELKKKKTKNVSTNMFGTLGTVHKEKQDYEEIQTRKMKGLKRAREERRANANSDADKGSEPEQEEKDAGAKQSPKRRKVDRS
eukprot:TRINITY_DN11132_c0_g1_i1.p1 TRINITY_DN11132_c0_g1~~TRINITY_DN11132_c0_g1_i1.p1  ORF type:complete len:106 (-),score=34.87 TRINITY_DN11132_c0_g1_i1:59-376(-)